MKRVVHITSVHVANDVRIFYRECLSLKKMGYDVSLIAPGEKDYVSDGIPILAIKQFKHRFFRLTLTSLFALFRSLKGKWEIYHFHDPELVPVMLILRLMGKRVVFDVHENLTASLESKEWLLIPWAWRWALSGFDKLVARFFDLILAEKSYVEKYEKYKANYKVILNMPDLHFFEPYQTDRSQLGNDIFYIGGVSKDRCIFVVIEALNILKKKGIDFHYHCIGPIDPNLHTELTSSESFKNLSNRVTIYGRLDGKEGYEISKKCKVGISLMRPIGNYVTSYSTKVFEYMAIGLPVITSNFKIYEDIVVKANAGICVDPEDPLEIANAIEKVFKDQTLARTFALNGKERAIEKYNWTNEAKELNQFYMSENAGRAQ